MKKKNIYLPTLNSLFMQDVHYRQHLLNLRNCKSSLEKYSQSLIINNKTLDLPHQVVLLQSERSQSSIRKIKAKALLRYQSTESSQRDKYKISSLEKRKLSFRDNQNCKIYQILKASKFSGYGLSKNNIKNYEQLRERISKFIREGNSVKYKFKKSLIEIDKRKESIKYNKSQNLRQSVCQQARKILQNFRNKKAEKNSRNSQCDIYLHTMRSQIENSSNNRYIQRTQTQQSHQVGINKQKSNQSVSKKQYEKQKVQTEPSFVDGVLPKNKMQNKKYTMDYICQMKIKKKEKFAQKAILPKTTTLKPKSNIYDMQVIQIQPKTLKSHLSSIG